MFKRVEKRLKRKQREDELGLDDDTREVLGLNDTDSDESDSDSDSDSDSNSHGDIPGADSDHDEVQGGFDGEEEEEASDNEVDQQSEERALITIAEALANPIFLVSLDPTINECIVCPGKQLKNQNMVEIHISSKAHERRLKQFKNLASSADAKLIAQDFVDENMSKNQPQLSTEPGASKRAEKKRLSQEKRKAKREKFKARQKAKKDALAKNSASKKDEPSNEAETSVGKEMLEEKDKHAPKNDGDKGKRRKKKANSASDVLKTSQHNSLDLPASPPKKKPKTSKSSTEVIPTTPAAHSIASSQNAKSKPSVPKGEKKITEGNGDKRQKKRKNKSDNTADISIPTEYAISDPPPSPPKKKRKLTSITTKAPAPNQKSNPAQPTAPGLTDDLPQDISELQAQVKDIIKSASDLAKAARARALNGGDSDDETKASAVKKMKKRVGKTKKLQQS